MFLGWFGGHHAVYVPPGLRGRVRQRAQPRENVCCALFHTASFSHRTPEAITKVDRELRGGGGRGRVSSFLAVVLLPSTIVTDRQMYGRILPGY